MSVREKKSWACVREIGEERWQKEGVVCTNPRVWMGKGKGMHCTYSGPRHSRMQRHGLKSVGSGFGGSGRELRPASPEPRLRPDEGKRHLGTCVWPSNDVSDEEGGGQVRGRRCVQVQKEEAGRCVNWVVVA